MHYEYAPVLPVEVRLRQEPLVADLPWQGQGLVHSPAKNGKGVGRLTLGDIRFELGAWSRLAKFLTTVAGHIGFEGPKNLVLRKRTSWDRKCVFY